MPEENIAAPTASSPVANWPSMDTDDPALVQKPIVLPIAQASVPAVVDPVDPNQPGFKERVTPKEAGKLNFFKCGCGSPHFRHAGYVKLMMPFLKPGGDKRVAIEQYQVQVCVTCRKAYVWVDEQMYDITKDIDLNAWEKAEKELHKATGPGGEC